MILFRTDDRQDMSEGYDVDDIFEHVSPVIEKRPRKSRRPRPQPKKTPPKPKVQSASYIPANWTPTTEAMYQRALAYENSSPVVRQRNARKEAAAHGYETMNRILMEQAKRRNLDMVTQYIKIEKNFIGGMK